MFPSGDVARRRGFAGFLGLKCEMCSESTFKLSGNESYAVFPATVVPRALNTGSDESRQTQNQLN